jgi:hypothetical protein
MSSILSGMDFALRPLLEHKVRKHLPAIIQAADPSIQQLCTLLEADIDTLRSQAQDDYQVELMEQYQFIVSFRQECEAGLFESEPAADGWSGADVIDK